MNELAIAVLRLGLLLALWIAARARRGSRGGRPPAFDAQAYRGRNVVERYFALAKQWRGLATRYDKLAILQGVENMYETDQVRPVLDRAAQLAGRDYTSTEDPADPHYEDDVRLRMVADHVRSSLMLIGDGVRPGNEGRGYVLRRLIRRVVRALRLMGVTEPVLPELLPVSRDAMKGVYPVVADEFDRISRICLLYTST